VKLACANYSFPSRPLRQEEGLMIYMESQGVRDHLKRNRGGVGRACHSQPQRMTLNLNNLESGASSDAAAASTKNLFHGLFGRSA
jgi:hypothetical protein